MDLYERMQNIQNKNIEQELQIAIRETRVELRNIVIKRRCKIHNSYLLEKLRQHHITAHLINTLDLGQNYEHFFVLVPDMSSGGGYFLADLTYSQFENKDPNQFGPLLQNGYQKINDLEFNAYLRNIEDTSAIISLDDAFYGTNEQNKKR